MKNGQTIILSCVSCQYKYIYIHIRTDHLFSGILFRTLLGPLHSICSSLQLTAIYSALLRHKHLVVYSKRANAGLIPYVRVVPGST